LKAVNCCASSFHEHYFISLSGEAELEHENHQFAQFSPFNYILNA